VARRLLPTVLAPLLTLVLAVPAVGAWVVGDPLGDAAAAGTAVAAPVSPTTSVTASSVTLMWGAPPTGAPPTGYTVQRTAPTSAAVCVAVAVTTCTDTGLSPTTTYSYAVTALVGLWVGPALTVSATTATPSPAAFLLTVPATATAGTQFTITLQARDGSGGNDPTYSGAHALTFSGPGTVGGNAPVYPATVTFNGSGYANNVKITLFKAETVTLTVADPAAPQRTGVSTAITVSPAPAKKVRWTSDAAGLVDACPSGVLVVGAGGQRSWYVAVLDQYGNRTVEGPGGRTVNISRNPGGATAGTATPTSLSVLPNANPAVTTTTTVLKLKKKNPAATTFTASANPLTAVSCTLSP